jgi:hypothetical protein
MTVNIQLTEEQKIKLIEKKGFKVQDMDFGRYHTVYHNQPEWRRDVDKGVVIDGLKHRLDAAVDRLYLDDAQRVVRVYLMDISNKLPSPERTLMGDYKADAG